LNALIAEVATLARTALSGRVKLVLDLSQSPLVTLADRSALEHALLNLVLNARDAMPSGGEITITTRSITLERSFCEAVPFDVKPGEAAHITVADTGIGMSSEVMEHIFEPFFTTKEEGSGTGLGLSAVHGTVVSHHGAIEVQSREGHGCSFHLYLPLHQVATPPAIVTTSSTSNHPQANAE
jgi:two-component system, cell cycle sensor histidine kinase and response regulator CckA